MPQIVGHRGAAGYAPENTLLSFEKAIELGCPAVELDVHLSKDGEVIVIHDAKVDRVTDGRGKVRKMTLEQLRALRCPLDQRLPTLREVLETIDGRARIFIELKVRGTVGPVVDLVREHGLTSRVVITSFKIGLLKLARQLDPSLRLNYLFYRKPLRLWSLVRRLRLNYIGPRLSVAKAKLVARAHKLRCKVYVYGVKDTADGVRMKKWGVDAICTDYPILFLRRPRA